MAGNAKPGEQDRPQEAETESTVAMESPGISADVPLPISNPPPAMNASAKPAPSPAAPAAAPAPSPNPAPAAGAAGARPPLGRPLGPPGIPTSTRSPAVGVGAGRVPLPSAGASGASGAKPPGAPLGPPGMSAKRTVMGIAPPANPNAPPKPAGPGGIGGVSPPQTPLQPAPPKSPGLPVRPGTPAAPAVAAPAKPPETSEGIPKLHSDDDEPPDDGPTLAADIGGLAALQAAAAAGSPLDHFALKPAASPTATAPHASAQMPPSSSMAAASQRSPFSSTGYTPSGPAAPPKQQKEDEETNEAATVTVPKDVLDRVRNDPKAFLAESKPKAPVPAAGRPYSDIDDSAEPTKAVPREELLGRANAQGDHVVIGADAGGEDATLAVPPGANEASGMNLGAAIGSALAQNNMGSPLGDPAFPPPPHGHPQGNPFQSYQGMGPPGSNPNPMIATQQSPGQGPPGMEWQQQGHPQQPWSSGHMPAANPRTPGGVQSYPGGPMMQQPQGMHPGMQGGIPRGQAPTNWNPLQAPPPKSKISGQMILLFVVGFVCLAIFVTGIVLFATTKF